MKTIVAAACLLIAFGVAVQISAQTQPNFRAPHPIAEAPGSVAQSEQPLPFRNPSLPTAQRVADLISRLTPDEKCGLVIMTTPGVPRLGIPAYEWWSEALHGVARAGKATSFPQAIALASSWDTDLMHSIATAISDEGRAKHPNDGPSGRYYGLTFWSPTINMARDPRWGRTEETYGEDPLLTGEMAVAFVRGMQGDNPEYLKLAATVKHFVANNEENVRHSTRPAIAERTLREYYFPQFRRAIMQGGVASIMTSYNGINDIPNSANPWLLQDVLRREWGFTGTVVTDVGAVMDVWRSHGKAGSMEEAIGMCLTAGCDVLDEQNNPRFQSQVLAAFLQSRFTTETLNRALTRNLTTRFQLGMFDPPDRVPYTKIPQSVVGSAEHVALARRAASEGIVLLKNDGAMLPLAKNKIKSIAVIGPNASRVYLGGYSGEPSQPAVSVVDGIKNKLGAGVAINAVAWPQPTGRRGGRAGRGAAPTTATLSRAAQPPTPETPLQKAIADSVEAAKRSDVAVVVLGLGAQYENEDRDRTTLNLPPEQNELLEKVRAVNKRTILILQTGGPVAIPWAHDHVGAILSMWYCGQEGGNGLADILFGEANPAARLPITFYASDAQLPPMGDYEISHGRTYLYLKDAPLWAFGHGLSYTAFQYGKPELSRAQLRPDEKLQILVPLRNTGKMDGDEVVQLYVRGMAPGLPEPQPFKSLRAFQRVSLRKGESKTVVLDLNAADLACWDTAQKSWKVTPGEYELQIGAASDDIRQKATIEIQPAAQTH